MEAYSSFSRRRGLQATMSVGEEVLVLTGLAVAG